MEPLILTFDVGTQSCRAMLINKKGEILVKKQHHYEELYFSTGEGYAEQKPNFYFDCMMKCLEEVSKSKNLMKDVKACTVTCIRDTVLCLDENNKPLRDIILWLDKREADLKDMPKVNPLLKGVLNLVGVKDMTEMQEKQSVCNWIMTKEKDIWKKTKHYVVLPTYLNYLLTGNLIDSVANQIGHIPIDYKNGVWMEKGLTRFLFDVPLDKLVPLKKPGEELGEIKEEICTKYNIPLHTKVIASGSDKGCETLGLSVLGEGKAAVSFGTTATIQFSTKKYFEPTPFAPSYPAVVDGFYNPEIQIYRGYWMLSWFKKEFCFEENEKAKKLGVATEVLLNEYLKDVPCGSNGLLLQPFWGAGVANPIAKGAIVGFSDIHTKKHLYRAIIEGINYALMEGLETMEKRGKQKITEIYLGGGGSQSTEICQIAADMFNLPTKRIQTHETCGLGAAMVAFTAIKEFNSIEEAIKNMSHDTDVFYPNKENHEVYACYYNMYKKIYNKVKPIYKDMKKGE